MTEKMILLSILPFLIVKMSSGTIQSTELSNTYKSIPIENRNIYYKNQAESEQTNWPPTKSTNRKRRTIETEGRKIFDFSAISPLIRDTFPKEDTSPPFDLSRNDRLWSNLQFLENPAHPNLLLQDPNDKIEDDTRNKPSALPDTALANQNLSLLNFLKMLQSRMQKNRWRSLGMSEINIPQDVISEYLLELINDPSGREKSQSFKNNLLTEEIVLPLIWDDGVSDKKLWKQNGRQSFKRTFLSQSWKPGGLAEKQTMPLQREKNRQESKSVNQNAYTMSILGLHGWRPGKKRQIGTTGRFYHSHDEDDDVNDYKSPEMRKEMVTLHITSRNSPRISNDDRDINMQIKKGIFSAGEEERSRRPSMEKLEGRMNDSDEKRWKMINRQRQSNV
ncbi:uncharacterized protein [Centruroides vittatus]|uniref:uncharacterized protein isoform X1 n=1 Tax=Centruroides vittatus TaxID=120091 RepID=UPI00350FDF2B